MDLKSLGAAKNFPEATFSRKSSSHNQQVMQMKVTMKRRGEEGKKRGFIEVEGVQVGGLK